MRVGLLAPARRIEHSFRVSSRAAFSESGGNLGNFAFVEALARHLGGQANIAPWHVPASEARERFDLIALAAANQLGAHHDLSGFAAHLEAIGLPVVVVGLGAQAPDLSTPPVLGAGVERFARTLAALSPGRAPNIGMRGEYSRRVLESLGLGDRAVVTGCPSHFLNDDPGFYDRLGRNFASRRTDRLGAAAGSRHFAAAQAFERRLVQLVDETRGAFVAQEPEAMLALARGEADDVSAAEVEALRQYMAPALSRESFLLWARRHVVAFSDALAWMEAMRGFDFVVGARFHGVMLALQAGVPGGVFAHDSRTLEMCETMAIPVRTQADFPAKFGFADLYRLFSLDLPRFAATRESLRRTYCELLEGCGLTPSPGLATAQANAP